MTAYYNEYDPKAAAWLRELIKAGLIAPGEVDERSVIDVKPSDIRGFTQCHFFAGIGGWSYALRLAGWADDRPCWTGSPPCQPFSNAGKQKAQADARHLWPVFFNLIRECRPANIFGEQVEAAIRTGWLDDLQDDLEAENYATGKIVLPACGFGGYHIRQRIWFVAERVADSINERSQGGLYRGADSAGENINRHPGCGRSDCGLADTADNGHAAADGLRETPESSEQTGAQNIGQSSGSCDNSGLANTESIGKCADESGRDSGKRQQLVGSESRGNSFYDGTVIATDAPNSIWRNPDWLWCRDGKWRPAESSLFGLFNGLPDELVRSCNISPACNPLAKDQEARTMRLKGYGNAIVPPLAAEVIKAYMEATDDLPA